jgi:predicted dehydrogenase
MNHGHIYNQTDTLLRAGAELVSYFAQEPDLVAHYGQSYPQAHLASGPVEILEDETIQLIVSAAIPAERAGLGISTMQHGKDFMSDKPGFTTLEQLAEARRVQATTGQIYSILYGERLENPATVKAGELVRAGLIGRVIQTIGFGPHRINLPSRPDWFFRKAQYGGILNDIGSHQFDQFLFFTGATSAEITAAHVANYNHPQYPELEDFGEVMLRAEGTTGYLRVDWFSPDGLDSWGDARLFLLGTEGYIEIRKNTDLGGRPGGSHLFYVTRTGRQYLDCSQGDLPYGRQLLADILNRTQTAMSQEHVFLTSELALLAERQAIRLGHLAE